MTIYTEEEIEHLYEEQFEKALKSLKGLKIFCGNEPRIRGLNGWIFEQVIQFCLLEELKNKGLSDVEIEEQASLRGGKKADLKIGNVIIEIKKEGFFGDRDIEKYKEYRKVADEKGLTYLYLTGGERVQKFIDGAIQVFGEGNCFFLDEKGSWGKFVDKVYKSLS